MPEKRGSEAAERIKELARETRSLCQHVGDLVNRYEEGELEHQPRAVNQLLTRAIACSDEIIRFADRL
ncbi:MAG: hypothetical protein IRY95_09780 [Clostridia bacterium]|nr:hypothetical protein [Clostridia bacterium]